MKPYDRAEQPAKHHRRKAIPESDDGVTRMVGWGGPAATDA
jgi:hypothetical protein